MERLCYVFELRAGEEEAYERAHAETWPGVVRAMREAGISNYTLFRRGSLVVAYGECAATVAESMSRLAADPVNTEWSRFIRQYMTNAVDEDGNLLFAQEIWRLPEAAEPA